MLSQHPPNISSHSKVCWMYLLLDVAVVFLVKVVFFFETSESKSWMKISWIGDSSPIVKCLIPWFLATSHIFLSEKPIKIIKKTLFWAQITIIPKPEVRTLKEHIFRRMSLTTPSHFLLVGYRVAEVAQERKSYTTRAFSLKKNDGFQSVKLQGFWMMAKSTNPP